MVRRARNPPPPWNQSKGTETRVVGRGETYMDVKDILVLLMFVLREGFEFGHDKIRVARNQLS